MKAVTASMLFAGLATAHSGVWRIDFDHVSYAYVHICPFSTNIAYRYPGRDARIEWMRGEKVKSAVLKEEKAWNPITDVESPAVTCK